MLDQYDKLCDAICANEQPNWFDPLSLERVAASIEVQPEFRSPTTWHARRIFHRLRRLGSSEALCESLASSAVKFGNSSQLRSAGGEAIAQRLKLRRLGISATGPDDVFVAAVATRLALRPVFAAEAAKIERHDGKRPRRVGQALSQRSDAVREYIPFVKTLFDGPQKMNTLQSHVVRLRLKKRKRRMSQLDSEAVAPAVNDAFDKYGAQQLRKRFRAAVLRQSVKTTPIAPPSASTRCKPASKLKTRASRGKNCAKRPIRKVAKPSINSSKGSKGSASVQAGKLGAGSSCGKGAVPVQASELGAGSSSSSSSGRKGTVHVEPGAGKRTSSSGNASTSPILVLQPSAGGSSSSTTGSENRGPPQHEKYYRVYRNQRYVQVFWPGSMTCDAITLPEHRQFIISFACPGDRKKGKPNEARALAIADQCVGLLLLGKTKQEAMQCRNELVKGSQTADLEES